ncbi:S9 family peptidase [Salinibacter ruber]|uniref:S9 family peptidase n=1 Tax=Salinibacter ruber TaxID=146919 RepID=UPI002167B978|nr:S9 family peptidase [Salinibacter ruber]MCS4100314.1 dipeptidyl aminopeptidase/acylaminoacyl peptidase [Salinibacter ruber]
MLLVGAVLMAVVVGRPAAPAFGQEAADEEGRVGGPGAANYELAERFAPYRIEDMAYDLTVDPQWIEGREGFWYDFETAEGTRYWIVDPEDGTQRELFDRERLASELTRITQDPWDAKHLPIENIRFVDENTLQFDVTSSQEVKDEDVEDVEEEQQKQDKEGAGDDEETEQKVFHFEYDVRTQTLRELEDYEEPDDHPDWANVSPDGETVVFARNYDLWMMDGAAYEKVLDARRGEDGEDAEEAVEELDLEETRLTKDGEKYYSYAANNDGRGKTDTKKQEEKGERKAVDISWAKDSRRFALVRSDLRDVEELWVVHATGNDRPELETFKYPMPGEDSVGRDELWIYDLEAMEKTRVADTGWTDQSLSILDDRQFRYPGSEAPRRRVWLSEGSDALWYERHSRDRTKADLVVADAETGEIERTVVEERFNKYFHTQRPELLSNGDVLWLSERDGWSHLYRYGPDGTVEAQLTEGDWHVDAVKAVDEEEGVAYVSGNGREAGEDPYYDHLYRVQLDGSGVELLNPGDADHSATMNESARFFVDNHSRVDTVPRAVLRNAEGEVVTELQTADLSSLNEAGWQMPEPFEVTAADGVTDLHGVMYKPFDFDPEKEYPVITYVYPGPQTEAVPKAFAPSGDEVGLAQLGFIVVVAGHRGGHPDRSRWYHTYGYGNLRDYPLADKKATIEQLAARHDFIDGDRVGIYGHSGGGFLTTASLLQYPDVFDVGVASSGNHENNVYNRWWAETHHGVEPTENDSGEVSFDFSIGKNSDLAGNLEGDLLLTTGTIDNNVHPANTYRMAKALIEAGKRFDLFVFPGQRHGYSSMDDYWFWLRAEYFAEHLLNDGRDRPNVTPLQQETPASERP